MVSVSVHYLFYWLMDKKIRTWTLCFAATENPNTEKAMFDWPIVLQYDVKAKYPLISRKFSAMKFFHPSVRLTNQKPRAFVSVRQTNHNALFPFVCCFCFVCAFSFLGHTIIALLGKQIVPRESTAKKVSFEWQNDGISSTCSKGRTTLQDSVILSASEG